MKSAQDGKEEREKEMRANGYPCYTTSCGWLGYADEEIEKVGNGVFRHIQ